jgi:hypothetical protein
MNILFTMIIKLSENNKGLINFESRECNGNGNAEVRKDNYT